MATKGVGTRNKPSSPLQLGVLDPEQILKTSRKIRRSYSSPSLCNPDQLDFSSPFSVLKGEEQDSSWLKPTIPVSNFQVFTDPKSFKKEKIISPEKSLYFISNLVKLHFSQVLVKSFHHLSEST